MKNDSQISEAAEFILDFFSAGCIRCAVILGSGLGSFAEKLEETVILDMKDIPHWPVPAVEGHKGRIILGRIGKSAILALQGRAHYYEGHDIQDVVFPVRVLSAMRVENLVLTNASGAVNPQFRPGDLMLIRDHINWMGVNPLIGLPAGTGGKAQFPDMSSVYDKEWIRLAKKTAADLSIPLKEGVLIASSGPSYETAAEVKMFGILGADAVCMSTVPEVIAAAREGIRVLAVSCITNMGSGLSEKPLSHDEVKETAGMAEEQFTLLIGSLIQKINDY